MGNRLPGKRDRSGIHALSLSLSRALQVKGKITAQYRVGILDFFFISLRCAVRLILPLASPFDFGFELSLGRLAVSLTHF